MKIRIAFFATLLVFFSFFSVETTAATESQHSCTLCESNVSPEVNADDFEMLSQLVEPLLHQRDINLHQHVHLPSTTAGNDIFKPPKFLRS